MARSTITDVALKADVSIKTVSRVLNGERAVKAETRERVQAAMAALDYSPSLSARSLAGARAYLLALVWDNPSAEYVSDLQRGAAARCRASGRHLLAEPVDGEAPADAIAQLVGAVKVDGFILTPPVCDDLAVLDVLDGAAAPYVRIAPARDSHRSASVAMNDEAAAYAMTQRLLELGHRDIAFVKGHPGHGAAEQRHAGFLAAMRERGLDVGPERMPQGWFSFRSGAQAAEGLMALTPRPTAVFAANDDMALGVIAAAARLGVTAPDQLSVAGFDDTAMARSVWPELSTVRQPVVEMAGAAADLLITGAATPKEGPPPRRMLGFDIIMRGTTGPRA
ncbi:MAG: LacI family DNA-binding transcriptional regulator [Caulobacteraceae bacterium]|nr:LacI family DNA-binding transcriptional regulator [Caulobacter sp.]